jgi:L-lactate dehydrogenase complex protein LldE
MPMKLGLFIPCYIDAFFPEVGVATLELLERLGCLGEYPLDQTCCGQPMANSGCQDDALENFRDNHLVMEMVHLIVFD